jgi:hypothetical protein
MMKLEDYKVVFAAVGLVGVLLFATPTLSLVVHLPSGEKFSELWVLGPGHMLEDYPFNVRADVNYTVYLGVGNDMDGSAYYRVLVKFRNESEALPNSTIGVESSLAPLYEYHVFLENSKNWEVPLTFTFSDVVFGESISSVGSLGFNEGTFKVDKPAAWDSENTGYYYELFMELWIYNVTTQAFQYGNRFVGFWLNMTGSV